MFLNENFCPEFLYDVGRYHDFALGDFYTIIPWCVPIKNKHQ